MIFNLLNVVNSNEVKRGADLVLLNMKAEKILMEQQILKEKLNNGNN